MIERDGDRVRLTLSSLEAGTLFSLLALDHVTLLCPVTHSLTLADLSEFSLPALGIAEVMNLMVSETQKHSAPVPDTMRLPDGGVTFELEIFPHFVMCQQLDVATTKLKMPPELVELLDKVITSAYLWTDDELLDAINGDSEPELRSANRAILAAGRAQAARAGLL